MYGWRARIGIIIPSVNTTFEPECNRMAIDGVSFHFSRMTIGDLSVDGLRKMDSEALEKGKELAAAGVDLVVFGCTSGSFIDGMAHDKKISQDLEAETGISAFTTSQAVLRALQSLSIKKFAIATPYSEELNIRQKEYFEAAGLKVTTIEGLGLVKKTPSFPLASRPVSHIGLQEPSVAYKLARKVDSKLAQAILISCTNFRTLEIIEKLERDLKKPVVTSIQATVWASLQVLSICEPLSGFGSLLKS
jgi:maleate isomerase